MFISYKEKRFVILFGLYCFDRCLIEYIVQLNIKNFMILEIIKIDVKIIKLIKGC